MSKLVRHAGAHLDSLANPLTTGGLLMVTTDTVPGHRIARVLGLVRGNTVRARNFGVDFFAGLKTLVGGEVRPYTAMLGQSREQALDRMSAEAVQLGANAIVAIRLTTSTVMQSAAEILAYGTAVVIEPDGAGGATGPTE